MNRPQLDNSDIKNQVLSDYFLHRKNAIYLKNRGAYWLSLDEFRTVLFGTPLSEESYKDADKIIGVINKIELDSYKEKGIIYCNTEWMQRTYRNKAARIIFNSVLRATTQILQNEGYLDIVIGEKSRMTITPISTLKAETNKPSDEAIPERLAEDMQ